MPNLLIHGACGPDDPSSGKLAFLVARTAASEGHHVTLFLAGDRASLLRDEALEGKGTGHQGEHLDVPVAAGVTRSCRR